MRTPTTRKGHKALNLAQFLPVVSYRRGIAHSVRDGGRSGPGGQSACCHAVVTGVTVRSPRRLPRMNRQQRLGQLMQRRGLDAVVLRHPANFAWYTGGADTKVDHAAPEGVADLIVGADSELVLASTIEAPRMRAEQTPDIEVVEYPWYEDRGSALSDVLGDARAGSDSGLADTVDLSDEMARLRWTLDPDAVEALRAVGRDTA